MSNFRYAWLTVITVLLFALVTACAPTAAKKEADPAKKEMKEEAKTEEPAAFLYTPDDATVEDGVLIFNKDPKFTLELVAGMKSIKALPAQIYSGLQDKSPFSLQVAIFQIEGDFAAFAKTSSESWIPGLTSLGSKKVEILRWEPTDLYEDFEAFEAEIAWEYNNFTLTNINHFIKKGDKMIALSSTIYGDPGQALSIFESIDLDP